MLRRARLGARQRIPGGVTGMRMWAWPPDGWRVLFALLAMIAVAALLLTAALP